jgi:hypothetical protein
MNDILAWSNEGSPIIGEQEIVNKFYEMDPETDTLLFDSTSLVDGMMILAANPEDRADNPGEHTTPLRTDLAREKNRWCIISDIAYEKYEGETRVSFIATYRNGSKRKRTCETTTPWLVRNANQ